VGVRLPPQMISNLDQLAKQNNLSRSEAIRSLIERAFTTAVPSGHAKAESRRKAADLAGRAIDALGDQTATVEERAHRKHRLIKGPREFRDVRGDQPKRKG
jgi:Arc/MetJ-type ribon-helix-helix transcriptional regulator